MLGSRRLLRWPNLVEVLIVTIAITALGWVTNSLWQWFPETSERILIAIVVLLILAPLVVLYERYRAEHISVAFTEPEYEKTLTKLAESHKGRITWVTKTSIWADSPDAYFGRLKSKIDGVKTGRIKQMQYIVHLGYWRERIADDRHADGTPPLELYRTKLTKLLRHLEDSDVCPPDKVQILIGETKQAGPPHRFGIYRSRRTAVLVSGYDLATGDEMLPRLVIKGHSELIQYYEDLFRQQWEVFRDRMVSSPTFSERTDSAVAMRRFAINTIRHELNWISSRSDHADPAMTTSLPMSQALRVLEQRERVTLSCPQKVCISGDYGDMHEGGLTLSAAVNIRPILTMTKTTDGKCSVIVKAREQAEGDSVDEVWPLVRAFEEQVSEIDEGYSIEVRPTPLHGIGLGSSGAGALLLAVALALTKHRMRSVHELIHDALEFEVGLAQWQCGPQDHVLAAIGGLRLIEYPSLRHHLIAHLSVWNALSFWYGGERRSAHDVIPSVVSSHTALMWERKKSVTRSIAEGFDRESIDLITEGFRNEYEIQEELGMVTELQRTSVAAIRALGAAAKVSGAGGGGVLLVVSPEERRDSIAGALSERGLTEISLHVDAQGLAVESPL